MKELLILFFIIAVIKILKKISEAGRAAGAAQGSFKKYVESEKELDAVLAEDAFLEEFKNKAKAVPVGWKDEDEKPPEILSVIGSFQGKAPVANARLAPSAAPDSPAADAAEEQEVIPDPEAPLSIVSDEEGAADMDLYPEDIARAVVLKEVLGPPLAMRENWPEELAG
jgi:Sec-independent protein translocase protein TatA